MTHYGYMNTMNSDSIPTFDDLKGHHLLKVVEDDEVLAFHLTDGRIFILHHNQDCCESVTIEDICGNLADLTGEILLASEDCSSENPKSSYDDDFLWTFYRIGTIHGTVVIRWYGASNGYYSVSVSFQEYLPGGRP